MTFHFKSSRKKIQSLTAIINSRIHHHTSKLSQSARAIHNTNARQANVTSPTIHRREPSRLVLGCLGCCSISQRRSSLQHETETSRSERDTHPIASFGFQSPFHCFYISCELCLPFHRVLVSILNSLSPLLIAILLDVVENDIHHVSTRGNPRSGLA